MSGPGSRAGPSRRSASEQGQSSDDEDVIPVRPDELKANMAGVQYLDKKIDYEHRQTAKSFNKIRADIANLDDKVSNLDDKISSIQDTLKELVQQNKGNNNERIPFATGSNNLPVAQPRDPDNRRCRREDTHDTHETQTSFTRTGENKIKREDVGTFDPWYEDPDDLGIVYEGKNTIFTDVYSFQERINTFREMPDTNTSNTQQLLELFQTLLAGPAMLWWNSELPSSERVQLRKKGLDDMMRALINRFKPEASIATQKFTTGVFTLRDLARDEYGLSQFIQKKLRYARAMDILTADNYNWHGVMIQIYSSLSLDVKQFLRAPRRDEKLEDYTMQIEETRSTLLSAAVDKYPYEKKKPRTSYASTSDLAVV
jgi:hypothetical protein